MSISKVEIGSSGGVGSVSVGVHSGSKSRVCVMSLVCSVVRVCVASSSIHPLLKTISPEIGYETPQ